MTVPVHFDHINLAFTNESNACCFSSTMLKRRDKVVGIMKSMANTNTTVMSHEKKVSLQGCGGCFSKKRIYQITKKNSSQMLFSIRELACSNYLFYIGHFFRTMGQTNTFWSKRCLRILISQPCKT